MKKKEKDIFLILFGKKLVEIRKQKGISQEQLCYDADISLSTISKLERGLLNVSIGNIFKLAKALNVSHKTLFDFEM